MYDRILVAIDAAYSPVLQRTEQFAKMTGGDVYLLHVGRGHIIPGDVMGGAGLGVPSAEDDVEDGVREVVQQAVNQLRAAGINARGELVNATEYDIADVILQRAKELAADVIVLGHQHHRGRGNAFRASVADQVIRQHPPCSILLAWPPER